VYDTDGYVADDDSFEAGVVVADPAMAETIVVPEDQVDPDTGDKTNSDDGVPMWVFVLAGVATLAILAGIVFACKQKTAESNVDQQTQGIDM